MEQQLKIKSQISEKTDEEDSQSQIFFEPKTPQLLHASERTTPIQRVEFDEHGRQGGDHNQEEIKQNPKQVIVISKVEHLDTQEGDLEREKSPKLSSEFLHKQEEVDPSQESQPRQNLRVAQKQSTNLSIVSQRSNLSPELSKTRLTQVSDNMPFIKDQMRTMLRQATMISQFSDNSMKSPQPVSLRESKELEMTFSHIQMRDQSQKDIRSSHNSNKKISPKISTLRGAQKRLRSNSSSRMSLGGVREIDELEEPFVYSQGNSEHFMFSPDILSEVGPDAPLSIMEDVRSEKQMREVPSRNKISSPQVQRGGSTFKRLMTQNFKDELPQPTFKQAIEATKSIQEIELSASENRSFSRERSSSPNRAQSPLRAQTPHRAQTPNIAETTHRSETPHKSQGSRSGMQQSPNRKEIKNPRKSNKPAVRQSTRKMGIRIVGQKEVPQILEKLSSSGLYRQLEEEHQKSKESRLAENHITPPCKTEMPQPHFEGGVVKGHIRSSEQTKEEDMHENGNSHTQTIKNNRDSQDTIGRGSEKTLPRHIEESPSDVRMLSPIFKNVKRQETKVSSCTDRLLNISSKNEITYKPPEQPESSISPKGKDKFEENFMKQLKQEVEEEQTLKEKKRSVSKFQPGVVSTTDMNRVVENLDRKKYKMLRNFIATPDQDAFDTIGSRQKILDDVISSSGSGSSINTMKNAPKEGIKFVDKSILNPYVANLVQKVAAQPMAPIQKNPKSYNRTQQQSQKTTIREYQQEGNVERKKELLMRMERMFRDDPYSSGERKQDQETIKYNNVNQSYTAGFNSRPGEWQNRTPTKPRTQRGIPKKRYYTPNFTVNQRGPQLKKRLSPKLPQNVRNQLYVPAMTNDIYTPVLQSHRHKRKKNDKFQMRRASNEFRVNYPSSAQMRNSRIKDLRMPNIREVDDRSYGSRNFREPRGSATEQYPPPDHPSTQFLDRHRQNFTNIYSSDSNLQEEFESPEGRGLSEVSLTTKPIHSYNQASRGPSGVSSGTGFRVNQNYSSKIHPVRPAVPRSIIRASIIRSTNDPKVIVASRHYSPKRKFRPYEQVDPALETLSSSNRRNHKILRRGAQGSPPEVPRAITRKLGTGHYLEPTYSQSASPTGERAHNYSYDENGPGTAFFPHQSQISSHPEDFDIELKVQSQEAKEFVKNSFKEDGVLRKISGILINKVKNESDSSFKLQSLSKSELVDAEVMPPLIEGYDSNPKLLSQSKSPRDQYPSPRNKSPDIQKVMSEALYSLEKGSSTGVMSFRSSKSRELRSELRSPEQGLPIDWADSLVYKDFLRGNLYFNGERNPSYYNEKDVDYILEMLKHKYREFKKSALTKPFFVKARNTLEKIMKDLSIAPQYENLERKYFEINIENTLRFLIRTKLLLGARAYLIELFALISKRDAFSVSLMRILQSSQSIKQYSSGSFEDPLTRGSIQDLNRDIKVVTSRIMKTLSNFQTDYKQFKGRFIFFDRDYIKVMRDDIKRIQSTLRNYEFQSTERF